MAKEVAELKEEAQILKQRTLRSEQIAVSHILLVPSPQSTFWLTLDSVM